MRTSINIADDLLLRARRMAQKQHRTLRDLVEEALRDKLKQTPSGKAFRLESHPFKGQGVQPGIREGDWEQIRSLIYPTG